MAVTVLMLVAVFVSVLRLIIVGIGKRKTIQAQKGVLAKVKRQTHVRNDPIPVGILVPTGLVEFLLLEFLGDGRLTAHLSL